MAFSFAEAVRDCRSQILMDLDASDFRWPDALMIRQANLVIAEILRKRPILLFKATNAYGKTEDYLLEDTALEEGANTEVNFPETYREAFIHGLAARCFGGDANNQTDASRMAFEKQRFDELMMQ